jgi:predicted GIY-YIG superfamily endonuclease
MTYVYILRSLQHADHYYVGATADLRSRLKKHNAGEVSHTSKYAPWTIKTYRVLGPEAGVCIREISQIAFWQSFREEAALILVALQQLRGTIPFAPAAHVFSHPTAPECRLL